MEGRKKGKWVGVFALLVLGVLVAGLFAKGRHKERQGMIRTMEDLVGESLDSGLAARLPVGDCSTREGAVLGHLRGWLDGSMREALFYETGALRTDTLAECEQEEIPEGELDAWEEWSLEDIGIRSAYVTRVECMPSVAPTQFVIEVRFVEEDGNVQMERWTSGLVWTNGEWKVDRVEDERMRVEGTGVE